MDITPALLKNTNFIKGYGQSGIKIHDLTIDYDLILSANLLEPWPNSDGIFARTSYLKLFELLKKAASDTNPIIMPIIIPVIIIGTGEIYQSPPADFFSFFEQEKITPEVMSTPAAARTFNVLVSEGREIYALLKNEK